MHLRGATWRTLKCMGTLLEAGTATSPIKSKNCGIAPNLVAIISALGRVC